MMLTFGRGLWAVGCDLAHAVSMATESHETRDDGGFTEADAAHQNHAAFGGGVGGA